MAIKRSLQIQLAQKRKLVTQTSWALCYLVSTTGSVLALCEGEQNEITKNATLILALRAT